MARARNAHRAFRGRTISLMLRAVEIPACWIAAVGSLVFAASSNANARCWWRRCWRVLNFIYLNARYFPILGSKGCSLNAGDLHLQALGCQPRLNRLVKFLFRQCDFSNFHICVRLHFDSVALEFFLTAKVARVVWRVWRDAAFLWPDTASRLPG
jgi:hypothetical protein